MAARCIFMRSWYDSTLKEEGFPVLEASDSSPQDKRPPLKDPLMEASFILSDRRVIVDVILNGKAFCAVSLYQPGRRIKIRA